MRVLHINTVFEYGSTGSYVLDIASTLERLGDEYFVAFGQGETSYPNSFRIGTKLENHLHNLGSRVLGKQGYFTRRGTIALVKYIKEIKPDVLHLSNLHGNYLNLKTLFNYLSQSNIPVVWTLHDCWAFTGKCAHYTDIGCYRWQVLCHHCPQIRRYPPSLFLDHSKQMFIDKRSWFTSVKNMTLVPVSNWLAGEVRKSFFANHPIVPVYNWVDSTIFKPTYDDVKTKYGIPQNKFIILGVSAGWNRRDSKLDDFIRLAHIISKDVMIVLVGGTKALPHIDSSILHIPYVHNTRELAGIYSAADVYVHLSLEDTFGKVIVEALSCGTPAIVYNSTACPEILGPGCGYVVEKKDVAGVFGAINKIRSNGKQSYSGRCAQHAGEKYDMAANIAKIISLYKDVSNS
jgi:putative colanic acid biosynthesis glycosyltransferase